jgi:hypothetical protein
MVCTIIEDFVLMIAAEDTFGLIFRIDNKFYCLYLIIN